MLKLSCLNINSVALTTFLMLAFLPQSFAITIINDEEDEIAVKVREPNSDSKCLVGSKTSVNYEYKHLMHSYGFEDNNSNSICLEFYILQGIGFWDVIRVDNSKSKNTDCTITMHNIKENDYKNTGTCSIVRDY